MADHRTIASEGFARQLDSRKKLDRDPDRPFDRDDIPAAVAALRSREGGAARAGEPSADFLDGYNPARFRFEPLPGDEDPAG